MVLYPEKIVSPRNIISKGFSIPVQRGNLRCCYFATIAQVIFTFTLETGLYTVHETAETLAMKQWKNALSLGLFLKL